MGVAPTAVAAAEASTTLELIALESLGGLTLGSVVPLAVSAWREAREPSARGALTMLWTHRLIEVCWSVAAGLNAASTHGKLLFWADGDTKRIAAAHAVGWTAAAAARALGPLPGWAALVERYPRAIWALGRLGMALDHLASLRCTSLKGWAGLHAICWGVTPLRSSLVAQGVCWRASAAYAGGPDAAARAGRWKTWTGNWSGAAGCAAAWGGARLMRVGRGDLTHKISMALCAAQAVLVYATPRVRGAASSGRQRRKREPPAPMRQLALCVYEGGTTGRRLALAAMCAIGSDAARVCGDALCLGPLGWRPTELAVYGSIASCAGNMMQTSGCAKALSVIGWRNTAMLGTVVAALGAAGITGVVGRSAQLQAAMAGAGAAPVVAVGAVVLAYGVAEHVLLRAWGGSQRYATQLLFIENAAPSLGGREQAAAAYDGLTQLVTLAAPAAWVALYSVGMHARAGGWLAALGPLGPLLLGAAAMRLCGTLVMSTLTTTEPAHRKLNPNASRPSTSLALQRYSSDFTHVCVAGWESAQARTGRLRQLLDPTAPAGFAREQRTYASLAQASGLQTVPKPPRPRQRGTGRIPVTAGGAELLVGRPWLEGAQRPTAAVVTAAASSSGSESSGSSTYSDSDEEGGS